MKYVRPDGSEIEVNEHQPGVHKYAESLGWKRKRKARGKAKTAPETVFDDKPDQLDKPD